MTGSSYGALVFVAAAALAVPACARASDMVIAMNGHSAYRIVVPRERSAAVDFAAAELQRYVREVSGAELPIVAEDEAGPGPAFVLGNCRRLAGTGLMREVRALRHDGVLLKTVGDDIAILGDGERGQVYAVYTFLERCLGCRFLTLDCTVIPKHEVLTLPALDYAHCSPFLYREELYNDFQDWRLSARYRLNGANLNQCIGRPWQDPEAPIQGLAIVPFVHSCLALVPPSVYLAEHPEYYCLVNGQRCADPIGGQLCFTNPDVLRIATAQVLEWLENNPGVLSIDVSQNDAWPGHYGACECENCRRVVAEEGAEHGPILRFVNAIAAEVAKRDPNAFVDTLAYQHTVAMPKVTKPAPNVIIRTCHHACYFHGVQEDPLGTVFRNAILDWSTVTPNLHVWHYRVNIWHYLAPNPNLESLAGDIKWYAEHGVSGLMVQGNIQSTGGEMSDFRQYLIAQLMWDPTQDPMVIRKDFCEGFYGPVSDEVMEFLANLDAFGRASPAHAPMNGWHPPDVTGPEFVNQQLEVLDRAYAKTDDPLYRNRVEKLMLAYWFVQLAWPDVYGISKEQGRATTARFKAVVERNGITTISEGPPNAAAFIAAAEAAFAE